ncbi:efflux RND transporter periplasmic adaptor subunit [soil metagenome]
MSARVWIGRAASVLAMIALLGAGAWWWMRPAASPSVSAAPQAPEVGVVELAVADVPLPLQYAGRVAGFRVVEVRAQVAGILLKREYDEGAIVKVGDVLFRIDPRPYEAALARATAQAAQARATLTQAEENFQRVEGLAARQVSTQKALEDATAARANAQAAVQFSQADVETAKLNLEYTVIRASITGPTSLTSPPEGSLIQAQQTLLTTITRLDPAYVNYTTTDSELRELQAINRARDKPLSREDVTLQLQFGDGTIYPQTGKVDTRARIVDPRTGTIQIRAVFPNHDGGLLPGQFVRLNILGVTMPDAVLVPKEAISQGPQGPFVYVVDGNSIAQVRQVKLDREVANGWIVRDGLEAGERIVVEGVIRVRPKTAVKPVTARTTL